MVTPAAAMVLICVIVPVAFLYFRAVYGPTGFTLEYLKTVLTQPQYVRSLLFTVALAGVVTMTSLLLAFPVCAFIVRQGKGVRALFVACVGVSFAISGLIRTLSWQLILSRSGVLDAALIWLQITDGPADLLYTRVAVVIGTTHVMTTYAMMIIYSGMTRIEYDYVIAARSMGASGLQTFATAYWPQIQASVVNAGLIIFMLSTGFFVAPALLGGPSDGMIGNMMLSDLVHNFEHGPYLAAAAGLVLTGILVLVGGVSLKLSASSFTRQRRNR